MKGNLVFKLSSIIVIGFLLLSSFIFPIDFNGSEEGLKSIVVEGYPIETLSDESNPASTRASPRPVRANVHGSSWGMVLKMTQRSIGE